MATIEQNRKRALCWQKHINKWQKSNCSQASYCATHHLNYYRFGYWRRKFLSEENTKTGS